MKINWLIALLFCSLISIAQHRPKVGLALSGGGAKCMAQLGALRAIEESGIKIDYISGTSMGAVIGAMYAMGYSVDEIESFLFQVDWERLMTNDIPQNRLPYLNRNDEKYLINVGLKDGKFHLPKAFNYGHYMLKILNYINWNFAEETDFSNFPIPFLCMATDLETGESVAFESGNLADALRASAAYPSIFSPYEIDGRLYVDGGVRNNLPISILKEQKKMDIVIAIDVQGNLYKKNELTGIIEVLEQVGSFTNVVYNQEQIKDADILIQPNVAAYGIDTYGESEEIISRGYNAAKEKEGELKKVGARMGPLTFAHNTQKIMPPEHFDVDSFCIEGAEEREARAIAGRLGLKNNTEYSLKKLDWGADALYGSGEFEKIQFKYQKKDSNNLLKVAVHKTPIKQYLRFGIHYDDDFGIALLANYTVFDALFKNAFFKAQVAFSENPRGEIAYIFRNKLSRSVGIRGKFNRFQPRIYENLEPIGQINLLSYSGEAFLQGTVFSQFTVGSSLRWENVMISQSIPFLGMDERNSQYLIGKVYMDLYSHERSFLPTSGMQIKADWNVIWPTFQNFESQSSSVFTAYFNKAIRISSKVGLQAGFTAASTLGGDLDYQYNIFVGGLGQNYINFTYPFVGYRFMELIGRNFGAAHIWAHYNFYGNHFFTAKGNIGRLEASIDGLFNSDVLLDGYGASYAYKSPIGPVELTVMGSTNHSNIYTYISFGFWF